MRDIADKADHQNTDAAENSSSGATPVWKKIIKAAVYASTAMIAPVSIGPRFRPRFSMGKLAIFLGVPLIAMPYATHLFPSAKNVLEENGYPAALVQDLAGDRSNIRVRPDNVWGHTHAFLSAPVYQTLLGRNAEWRHMREEGVLGYAKKGHGWDPDIIYVAEDRLKEMHAPWRNPRSMSYNDEWLHTFLHEVRHVSAENAKMGSTLAREADSDYQAARAIVQHLDRPSFVQQLLHYKSGSFAETHDTALYLSARFNGRAAPDIAQMHEANQQARAAMDEMQIKGFSHFMGAVDCYTKETPRRVCRYTVNGEPVSDLAKERMSMHFRNFLQTPQAKVTIDIPVPPSGAAGAPSHSAPKETASGGRKPALPRTPS